MSEDGSTVRLQNSPVFLRIQVRAEVNKRSENRERDWGETLKIREKNMENGQSVFFLRACEARARKTLTPHFADFFPDFEKKTDCFAV